MVCPGAIAPSGMKTTTPSVFETTPPAAPIWKSTSSAGVVGPGAPQERNGSAEANHQSARQDRGFTSRTNTLQRQGW